MSVDNFLRHKDIRMSERERDSWFTEVLLAVLDPKECEGDCVTVFDVPGRSGVVLVRACREHGGWYFEDRDIW